MSISYFRTRYTVLALLPDMLRVCRQRKQLSVSIKANRRKLLVISDVYLLTHILNCQFGLFIKIHPYLYAGHNNTT